MEKRAIISHCERPCNYCSIRDYMNGELHNNSQSLVEKKNNEQPCKKTEFDALFQYSKPPKPVLSKRIGKSVRCSPIKVITSLFPILSWLPNYKWKSDLIPDIISGFTVAVMHIPQGMAYSMLAGVPPIVGIYMAFFPVLIYVVMGTSRHVSMGTFAVICMMTSKSVLMYSNEESSHPSTLVDANATDSSLGNLTSASSESVGYTTIQVATAVCFAVGVWQILLGVLHLGVVSVLLSDTLVSGFTTGAAVHVLTSQVKNLFGIKIQRFNGPLKIVYTYIDLFKNISKTNLISLGISAIAILLLSIYNELIKPRIGKKLPIPLPTELLVIITGTLVSMYVHLNEKFSVTVLGEIPTGFPPFSPPPLELLPKVLTDGFTISIVAFSVNMSMASIFARKLKYSINANQELLASGTANIFGSFFSCVPFAASLSRSLIQQTVGGRTQLASVVSCLLLTLVLLVIGPFFEPLPNCVLASIVVVALKGMFMQIKEVPKIWHESRKEGLIWIVTFLAVVFIDIDYGLAIGIALALLCVLIMGQRPKVYLMGHVPNTHIYLDLSRYQAAEALPGIKIIHIDGGLHFANKDNVRSKIYKLLGAIPEAGKDGDSEKASNSEKVYCVILDMMSVTFVDPSSTKTLLAIFADLESKAVLFCIADCSATVYERLVHCSFFEDFPETQVFPTVHDAVLYANQTVPTENR
ncbi:sulfate transporter-like isoform X1 [Schistocerca cancellata]|uniref:sulfate transporter-like isoform X1 n=2 Tax=Schistocerca cancellata TaxID=274614 RepID=UPI002117B9EC|nr:sulfate transporter-like isoform X1 [Schistocerca cancellata]